MLVKSSALLKSFLNRGFDVLKMISVIPKLLFSHTHAHTHIHTHTHKFLNTQILLSPHGYFFLLAQPSFGISFPIKPTQLESLSNSEKHRSNYMILYKVCYFSDKHTIITIPHTHTHIIGKFRSC